MAIPYDQTVTGTSVRDALDLHLRIKHNGAWQHTEDVQVKHSGAWRDTKEVWVKSGGTWRLVHEGEHFLFNVEVTGETNGEFSLSNWISNTGGYSGNKIKGLVTIGSATDASTNGTRNQVNLGSFSADSKIYLRINLNCRITGNGGNGGNNGGQNGQAGQRALYTRTNFILDNAGTIAGGGGGGGGGNNSNCVYQNTNYFSCQKGQQCSELVQNQSPSDGGGGGGGAGYPGGSGGSGHQAGGNGQQWAGGGGGGNGGCGANSGGKGGDLGQNGQAADNSGGTAGSTGTGIDGWSYRYSQSGNADGDIRGPQIN